MDNFTKLYRRALKDWPAQIEFGSLRYTDELTNLYSVPDLFEMSEEISAKYIGAPDEILMRTLHDAIFIELHRLAPVISSLSSGALRERAIESRFHQRLSKAIKVDGWLVLTCPQEIGPK